MQQVLFHIPLNWLNANWPDIPIYGYGFMLFLAFIGCTWLAARLGRPYGLRKEHVQDLALWMFLVGIVGARITFMIQYRHQYTNPIVQFFFLWDGGLVFYGSLIGGFVGFLVGYWLIIRKLNIPLARLADVIAPCIALGLCLGRIGCLLNGCCYGNVACEHCPGISFPLASPPRYAMTARGYQTAAGFTMAEKAEDRRTVGRVEPGSPAAAAGLQSGDVIVRAEGQPIRNYYDLVHLFLEAWPRGQSTLQLTVERRRADNTGLAQVTLPPFTPWTISLHPTQLYESISAVLLLFLLLSYWPFRRRDGEVIALFLICYSIHRFINEALRTDTDPVAFGLTLSQNISILVLAVGLALGVRCWVFPGPPNPPSPPTTRPEEQAPAQENPPERALQDEGSRALLTPAWWPEPTGWWVPASYW